MFPEFILGIYSGNIGDSFPSFGDFILDVRKFILDFWEFILDLWKFILDENSIYYIIFASFKIGRPIFLIQDRTTDSEWDAIQDWTQHIYLISFYYKAINLNHQIEYIFKGCIHSYRNFFLFIVITFISISNRHNISTLSFMSQTQTPIQSQLIHILTVLLFSFAHKW